MKGARLAMVYLAFAVLFALHATVAALRDHYTAPLLDDWRILDEFFTRPLGQFLFRDQNGHRIPATLLLVIGDYRLFGGRMHLLVAASLLCAWLAAGALYLCARSARPVPPLAIATYAFAGFALFWAGSCHDFIWGMNQGSVQAAMWLLVAMAALARYQARGERPAGHLPVAAGLAAVLANFSHGTGAATWPAVLAVAFAGRLPRRVIGGLAIAAILSIWLYSSGLENTGWRRPGRAYSRILVHQLPRVASLATAFVGGAVARAGAALGWGVEAVSDANGLYRAGFAIGAIGLALAVLFVWRCRRRRAPLGPLETLAVGLTTFSLAAGLLVGMARAPFPLTAIQDRFTTWSTLFWIGIVAAGASLMLRRAPGWIGSLLGIGAIGALSLCMLPGLEEARRQQAFWRDAQALSAASHLLGLQAREWTGLDPSLPPDPAIARVMTRLRRERRGIFADARAGLPGARLRDRFPETRAQSCEGTIEWGAPLRVDAGGLAARVVGHLSSAVADEAAWDLVFVDDQQVIRGLGVVNRARPRVPTGSGPAWVGLIPDFDAEARYTVYGVLPDGKSVCLVRPPARIPFQKALAPNPGS